MCDQCKSLIELTSKEDKDFERFLSAYNNDTKKVYRKAVNSSVRTIGAELLKLGESSTQQQVVDTAIFHLFRTWGNNFSKKELSVISKYVTQSYKFFRKDRAIFGKVEDGIPAATFNTVDFRTIDYYKKSDGLYLGKFITDKDTKKKISDFIVDEYVKGHTPIGNNRDALGKFKNKFEGVLNGEDWKIRRVIDTSLNKLRNSAAVNYMNQAEVEEYEIVGIEDNQQSEFCRNITGRVFSVRKAMDSLNSLANSDPANVAAVSPFGVSLIKAGDIPGTTTEALEKMGLGTPPYHGHCRTTIAAVL